jgi:predicted nucleic acid-binding Zn ribbon protein
MQKMSEDPLTECDKCGGSLRKVLHPVAIHFKGSGFYTTDYGKGSGKRPAAKESGADTSASDAGGGSSDRGDGSKTEKKASGEGKSKETQKAT